MSRKLGIDAIVRDTQQDVGAYIRSLHNTFDRILHWSPIEALLMSALCARSVFSDVNEHRIGIYETDGPFSDREAHVERARDGEIIALLQCNYEKWKIDFVLGIKTCGKVPRWLAIECDGHDYHERTKEQAKKDRSRDRALQAAGFVVLRFTGSEIYTDPAKCAREVFDWLNRIYWEID